MVTMQQSTKITARHKTYSTVQYSTVSYSETEHLPENTKLNATQRKHNKTLSLSMSKHTVTEPVSYPVIIASVLTEAKIIHQIEYKPAAAAAATAATAAILIP